MKENLKTIKDMVKEHLSGKTVKSTKALGIKVNNMELEFSSVLTK
jgi:hypothetical protein